MTGAAFLISTLMMTATSADNISEVEALPVDTVQLEELTVTSIKQSSRLAALPVAASVISNEELRQLNAVTIKGISDVVPNFFVPDYGSRITSSIYVRGLGARMDQPAVGLNVDNVPFLNKDAYDFDIPDIVSVQMLRGPQSTLYGRNTMGGQINVSTLSPFDYQGARFSLDVANGGHIAASAGWYDKLSSVFAIGAVAQYSHSRGFFKNEFDGKFLDHENSGGLRIKAEWRPAPSFSLRNNFSFSLLRQGGYPYEYLPDNTIAYNDPCFYNRFLLNDGLTIKWSTEKIILSSITSLQYINDNMTLDQDFLTLDYFTLTQKKREIGITQDLIVKPAAPSGIYSWLAGIFGFYKHLNMDAPVTFKDYGIAQLIEKHRNEANPDFPIGWDDRTFPLNSTFKMPVFGIAAYHESKLDFDRWHLTAGIRFDYERPQMSYNSYCSTGYTIYNRYDGADEVYEHVDIDINDHGSLNRNFFSIMPKLGILYDISDSNVSNVYLNVSRGYKSGGFNTQMFSDVLQQRLMGVMGIGGSYKVEDIVSYKPESSWNYEIGAHLSFPDFNLTADAAIFYIDCRNQQLTMFPDGLTTGRIMTNAGKTRSYGGEITLRYNPVDNLAFNTSYGYTNAKFTRFFDGKENYAGKFIPYAPRNTLFIQSLYTLNVGKSRFCRSIIFDLNLRGTGDIYWNEANTARQNFYALLGASVTLEAQKFSLQLWTKNITDTKYHTFYFVSIGNEFVQRGKPFQIGLSLQYNL